MINNDYNFKDEEDKTKENINRDMNLDLLEDAVDTEDHSPNKFEEDDSDGVYLKPKHNNSENEEDDMDNMDSDDDAGLWKL